MNNEIYILTGEIQTGKTTTLLNWIINKNNVCGILTPVIDSKRMFLNISNKELFEMEANLNEKDVLLIGKFLFSISAFSKLPVRQ